MIGVDVSQNNRQRTKFRPREADWLWNSISEHHDAKRYPFMGSENGLGSFLSTGINARMSIKGRMWVYESSWYLYKHPKPAAPLWSIRIAKASFLAYIYSLIIIPVTFRIFKTSRTATTSHKHAYIHHPPPRRNSHLLARSTITGQGLPFVVRWADGRVESRGLHELGFGHVVRSLEVNGTLPGGDNGTLGKRQDNNDDEGEVTITGQGDPDAQDAADLPIPSFDKRDAFNRVTAGIDSTDGKKVAWDRTCNACGGFAQLIDNTDFFATEVCNFLVPSLSGGATALGVYFHVSSSASGSFIEHLRSLDLCRLTRILCRVVRLMEILQQYWRLLLRSRERFVLSPFVAFLFPNILLPMSKLPNFLVSNRSIERHQV